MVAELPNVLIERRECIRLKIVVTCLDMLVHSKRCVDMDNNETSAMASIPDQLIRAYAQGAIAWRDIQEATQVENFNVMLDGLASLELKLPQAPIDRPTRARGWLRDAISQNGITA